MRDRVGCVALWLICAVVIGGGFWYVRDHHAPASESRYAVSGVVVAKRAELPGLKRMYPVKFVLVVQEATGERRTLYVDRTIYSKAAIGSTVVRDQRGNVSLSASAPQRPSD